MKWLQTVNVREFWGGCVIIFAQHKDELTSPALIRMWFWSTTPTFWKCLCKFPSAGAVKKKRKKKRGAGTPPHLQWLRAVDHNLFLTDYVLICIDMKKKRCTFGSNRDGTQHKDLSLEWLPIALGERASKANMKSIKSFYTALYNIPNPFFCFFWVTTASESLLQSSALGDCMRT